MGKEKKHKPKQLTPSSEYNLQNSISKIRNNRPNPTDNFNTNDISSNSNRLHAFSNHENDQTGTILSLNDKFNDKYDSLNKDFSDKITLVNEKINNCEQNLRDKLEDQNKTLTSKIENKIKELNIDDKVGKYLFGGAIATIILITTVIYYISYSHIIEDTKKIPTMEERIKNLENINSDNKK